MRVNDARSRRLVVASLLAPLIIVSLVGILADPGGFGPFGAFLLIVAALLTAIVWLGRKIDPVRKREDEEAARLRCLLDDPQEVQRWLKGRP